MKKNKKGLPRGRSKGFTLIEMVVVVLIIAILASIAFVSYESSRKQARDARRVADMVNIESTLRMYYLKNTGFPATGSLSALKDEGYFQKLPQTPDATPIDYGYYSATTYAILYTTVESAGNRPSTKYTEADENEGAIKCSTVDTTFCLKIVP